MPTAAIAPAATPDWEAVLDRAVASGAIANAADLPPEPPAEPLPTPAQMRDLERIARGDIYIGDPDPGMWRRLRRAGWIAERRDVLTPRGGEVLTAAAVTEGGLTLPPLPLGTPFFVTTIDGFAATVAIEEAAVVTRFPVRERDGSVFMCYVDAHGVGFADRRSSEQDTEVFLLSTLDTTGQRPYWRRIRTCFGRGLDETNALPNQTLRGFLTRAAAEAHLRDHIERLRAACLGN